MRFSLSLLRTAVVGLVFFGLFSRVSAADLSGSWKDSNGGTIEIVQNGANVVASGTNEIVTRWWTKGNGTLTGNSIRMVHSKGGRTTDTQNGTVTGDSRIDWANGSHWVRTDRVPAPMASKIQIVDVTLRDGETSFRRQGFHVPTARELGKAVLTHVDGKPFLLVPDTGNALIWFYAPLSVQLKEKQIRRGRSGNTTETWPELSLLYFQKASADGQRIEDGATLRLSLPIALDDPALIDELEARLLSGSATLRAICSHMPWQGQEEAAWLKNVASKQRSAFLPAGLNSREDPLWNSLPNAARAIITSGSELEGEGILKFQKARVLPRLQLLPLPVQRTSVRFFKPGADELSLVDELVHGVDERFTFGFRYFGNLRRTDLRSDLSREEARLAESLLLNAASGLRIEALLDYQMREPRTDHLLIDPGLILEEWLVRVAARDTRSETENHLVEILYGEFRHAVSSGYRASRTEALQWTRLSRGDSHVRPDPQDVAELAQHRLLKLSAWYFINRKLIRPTIGYSMFHAYNNHDWGNHLFYQDHLQSLETRAKAGGRYLSFIPFDGYRPKYRTGDRIAAGKWVIFSPERTAFTAHLSRGPATVKDIALMDALMLFEAPPHDTFPGHVGARLETIKQIDESRPNRFNPSQPSLKRTYQPLVRRVSLDGGQFLNLSAYPNDVISRLVALDPAPVQPGGILLPDHTIDLWTGMKKITLRPSIQVNAPSGSAIANRLESAVSGEGPSLRREGNRLFIEFPDVTWSPRGGWSGAEKGALEFPLRKLSDDHAQFLKTNSDFLQAHYVIDEVVSHPNGDITLEHRLPVFEGTRLMPPLNERLDAIIFDFEGITWSNVDRISVHLEQNGRTLDTDVRSNNGTIPNQLVWLIHPPDQNNQPAITGQLRIHYQDGSSKSWDSNGRNLADKFFTNYLFDRSWR